MMALMAFVHIQVKKGTLPAPHCAHTRIYDPTTRRHFMRRHFMPSQRLLHSAQQRTLPHERLHL